MITVRQFRQQLQSLIASGAPLPPEQRAAWLCLDTTLGKYDEMSLSDFLHRLTLKKGASKPGPAKTIAPTAAEISAKLRAVFSNDHAFEQELDALEAQKAVTKPILTETFYQLFDRTRGIPKSATRAELLRLIADERLVSVRDEKMGKMLGRRMATID